MADQVTDELEKQEPIKPEKKSGMSMPLMIGAAVGVLVIVMLGVVLGVVVASKFIMPQSGGDAHSADGKTIKGKGEAGTNHEDEYENQERYLTKLHEIMLMETGRITTNPKGAASVFVVVNFGLEFKKMDPENEELATLADKEGALNMESPIMKKLMGRMRGILNKMLASYTQDELLAKRAELPDMVKKELKPVFKDYELALGNVTLQEFIIQ